MATVTATEQMRCRSLSNHSYRRKFARDATTQKADCKQLGGKKYSDSATAISSQSQWDDDLSWQRYRQSFGAYFERFHLSRWSSKIVTSKSSRSEGDDDLIILIVNNAVLVSTP